MTDRTELAHRIYERAHLTGQFTLRSGAVSTEYFDKYLFEGDPELLATIAEALASLVPPGTEALAGLELGGVPLATMCSKVTGLARGCNATRGAKCPLLTASSAARRLMKASASGVSPCIYVGLGRVTIS